MSDWSWSWSPDEINFLLFVSVWTILALAYLVIAPVRFATAAHKFGILAAEALTTIFWFAGWVAVAALLGMSILWTSRAFSTSLLILFSCTGEIGGCQRWGPCKAAIAATIFSAFEW